MRVHKNGKSSQIDSKQEDAVANQSDEIDEVDRKKESQDPIPSKDLPVMPSTSIFARQLITSSRSFIFAVPQAVRAVRKAWQV